MNADIDENGEPMKYGLMYVKHVNKFLKGKYVGDDIDEWDIETKTTFYEIKGARLMHKQGPDHYPRLSKYRIVKENHVNIKKEADKADKIAKYIFVLDSPFLRFTYSLFNRVYKSMLPHKININPVVELVQRLNNNAMY